MALRARGIAAVVIVAAVVLLMNDRLLHQAAIDNSTSRVNWLYQTPSTDFDVAILGSSLSKEGIDPVYLSELVDRKVVQLAWGGRGIAEQALYWELFLQRHDCKLLLIELHPSGLEENAFPHPLDEFRYLHHLNDPIVSRHLSRHCGRWPVRMWRWIPMWDIAEFNMFIGWHDLLALRHDAPFDPNRMGENTAIYSAEELRRQRSNATYPPGSRAIDSRSVAQFIEILKLCRARSIEIVAFLPPQFGGISEADFRAIDFYREIIQLALPDKDIPIVLPVDAEYLKDASSFQDAFHLSRTGSHFFTRQIADVIDQHEIP
jgi:hypothetical protein